MFFRISSVLLLVVGLFLWGLGQIATLPPFEGMDERAHWSAIREIASGSIPSLGQSYIDQAYEAYGGPHPYSIEPPYDHERTYATFFNKLQTTMPRNQTPAPFKPGSELNWQAQHPPLYYLLMASVERAIAPANIVASFFVLRLASYILALAGVLLGLLAVPKDNPQNYGGLAGFFAYPLMFPMFFPEFTRLTNDALCLFLIGVLAFALSRWRRASDNLWQASLSGLALTLGLLTKAFFIPITLALAASFGLRAMCKAGEKSSPREGLALLIMFYPALIIGGGWYLVRFADVGGIGVDALLLASKGGLIAGLKEHFSVLLFGESLARTFSSFLWAGTWSLVHVPFALLLPIAAMFVWVFTLYLREARKHPLSDLLWLPAWFLAAFGTGLVHHIFIGIALDGAGHTPGWYLHILMPFIAPALGIGIKQAWQSKKRRSILIAGFIYAAVFQSVVLWCQFALFTGCALKGEGGSYAFPDGTFCLDQLPLLIQRLAVLGWPSMALVGFGGGFIVALILSKRALLSRSNF